MAGLWARVARAPHRLLVLDYDGTLAPHRRRLQPVAPIDGALKRLERLSRRPGTTLAIVSGRRADDLQLLLGGLHALRVAEHGWDEIRPDGRRRAHRLPVATRRALAAAARAVATLPEDVVEVKRTAIVLNTRGLRPTAARALERAVRRLWRPLLRHGGTRGDALRLDVTSGGLELRAAGRHKGTVVRALLAGLRAGTLPVVVGDDRSDEDAFAAVTRRGVAIRVGHGRQRSHATLRLASPRAVVQFLDRWLATPGARRGSPRGRA